MKILSMSGFVPEEICDTVRFSGYTGERNITHFCGYANDFISQVMLDDSIDGAIFPRSCDSTRIIPSYLKGSSKFQYQLKVPARSDDYAIEYFAMQLKQLRVAIEEYYHEELGDISNRIEMVNCRNEIIGSYYEKLDRISYKDYIDAIHEELSVALHESKHDELNRIEVTNPTYKHRVYLIGSFLANTDIIRKIEGCGLKIVGDNLPESGRIQNSIVESFDEDVYAAISRKVLSRRLSPTQNNFSKIISFDVNEMCKLHAEGVIFVSQKYCEPYDYLYSVYKKKLDELHIPVLHLSLSNSEDLSKAKLMIEAFADTL